MIKMDYPADVMECSYLACVDGVSHAELRSRYESVLRDMLWLGDEYKDYAIKGELYKLKPVVDAAYEDPVVVGNVSRREFLDLYNYYMVKRIPGRNVYDRIMVSSNERCPYCCGIGRPKNIDHYLPKTSYPQFSVLPFNLVPSCRDCNMDGKGRSYAKIEAEQVIHPYLDHARFFDEQWLFARYVPDEVVGVVEYFVNAPERWRAEDKARVKNHFEGFGLGVRFSKEAGARLVTLYPQIESLIGIGLDDMQVRDILFAPAIGSLQSLNHWERVMYVALMEHKFG